MFPCVFCIVGHPDGKNKLPNMDSLPPLKKEELIELLKDVEKEINILNSHVLKPPNETQEFIKYRETG